MPDIFLSYNREDQPVARRFAEAFQAAGLEVWWDTTLRAGEAYDRVTEQALEGAGAVVVLWSSRSVESRWVRAEATQADRLGALIPAMIEPCKRPIMFELTQTADLSHWDGSPADAAWQAFLADVRWFIESRTGGALPDRPATPAPAPRLAPETLQAAERRLREMMGPIAGRLVTAAAAGARTEGELYAELAKSIPSERERAKFLGRVAGPPGEAKGQKDGSAPDGEVPLAPDELGRIAKALTRRLGPIAARLVEREHAQAASRGDLFRRLAARIASDADRAGFLKDIGG